MSIIIEGNDLYSMPSAENPAGGVLYRTGKRIKSRLDAGHIVTPREKRNMLIGEVGEAAVMADFKNRGFNITLLSWEEFSDNRNETAIDIIAIKDQLVRKVQVKASENGNRSLRNFNMSAYERANIDSIVFVATRELDRLDGTRYFECEITSQLSPRQIRMMACWERKDAGWQHSDNADFIKNWNLQSARKGSKKLLTPSDVWDLTC